MPLPMFLSVVKDEQYVCLEAGEEGQKNTNLSPCLLDTVK